MSRFRDGGKLAIGVAVRVHRVVLPRGGVSRGALLLLRPAGDVFQCAPAAIFSALTALAVPWNASAHLMARKANPAGHAAASDPTARIAELCQKFCAEFAGQLPSEIIHKVVEQLAQHCYADPGNLLWQSRKFLQRWQQWSTTIASYVRPLLESDETCRSVQQRACVRYAEQYGVCLRPKTPDHIHCRMKDILRQEIERLGVAPPARLLRRMLMDELRKLYCGIAPELLELLTAYAVHRGGADRSLQACREQILNWLQIGYWQKFMAALQAELCRVLPEAPERCAEVRATILVFFTAHPERLPYYMELSPDVRVRVMVRDASAGNFFEHDATLPMAATRPARLVEKMRVRYPALSGALIDAVAAHVQTLHASDDHHKLWAMLDSYLKTSARHATQLDAVLARAAPDLAEPGAVRNQALEQIFSEARTRSDNATLFRLARCAARFVKKTDMELPALERALYCAAIVQRLHEKLPGVPMELIERAVDQVAAREKNEKFWPFRAKKLALEWNHRKPSWPLDHAP